MGKHRYGGYTRFHKRKSIVVWDKYGVGIGHFKLRHGKKLRRG